MSNDHLPGPRQLGHHGRGGDAEEYGDDSCHARQPANINIEAKQEFIYFYNRALDDGGFNAIKLILTGLFEGPKCWALIIHGMTGLGTFQDGRTLPIKSPVSWKYKVSLRSASLIKSTSSSLRSHSRLVVDITLQTFNQIIFSIREIIIIKAGPLKRIIIKKYWQ